MFNTGIISSLSFCTDYSGLFAAGTFSSQVALFSEETGGQPQLFLEGTTSAVTQVSISLPLLNIHHDLRRCIHSRRFNSTKPSQISCTQLRVAQKKSFAGTSATLPRYCGHITNLRKVQTKRWYSTLILQDDGFVLVMRFAVQHS